MKVFENSNIVNWDDYPDYVCALVMQTTKDIKTTKGFICPKGEELIWLADKAPKISGEDVEINNANMNCLGGLGPGNGCYSGVFPADLRELHFKPKPVVKTESKKECYA